jgi:hypothetical protein
MRSRPRVLSIALALAVLSISFVGLVRAQGPEGGQGPEAPASPAAPAAPQADLTNAITYQGQLKQGNLLVNAVCDFRFAPWTDPTGGYADAAPVERDGIQVTGGLFTVSDLTMGGIAGQRRWLQIEVRCPTVTGSWVTLAPRQELTAAPYALSLRPGAEIIGDRGGWPNAVLKIYNDNTTPNNQGDALWAVTQHTYGWGVFGESPAGRGVYGNSSLGYGGVFQSSAGYALSAMGPVLLGGRNPKQIAMLRWYDANKTGRVIEVGNNPDQMVFDGEHIWVTVYGDNKVVKIKASDGTVIGTYPSPCSHPNALAFDGTLIWVASEDAPCLSPLRATTGDQTGTVITDGNYLTYGHWGMAFDGENIWVTNSDSNSVARFHQPDLAGTKFTVGLHPTGIAFDGFNIWTANNGDNSYSRVSPDGYVTTWPLPAGQTGPYGLAFDGANIWIANSSSATVGKIRTSDGAYLQSVNVGSGPFFLAFDGYNMWITRYTHPGYLVRVAVNGWGETKTFATGSYPIGVAFDGANVWTADSYSSQVMRH